MDATQRIDRWRRARAAHLAGLPWLAEDLTGRQPVRYVAGELLVTATHHEDARRTVADLGIRATDLTEDEPLPGILRLRARGLDAVRATRQLRGRLSPDAVVGPNHVLIATPHEQGGPFGRPAATNAATIDPTAAPDTAIRVVVMDTGVWADSPLPTARYQVSALDYESNVDVDHDNSIDSDVGHANFIAGVVLQGTQQARVQVVKVLDTFGVTTELDLAIRIAALSDVDILNLSLGAFTADDQPPVLLRAALDTFLSGHDRVVVAAAGNDGCPDRPFWPAAFSRAAVSWADQVIAVAAHDGTAICAWSNTGAWVDVAAPGADVVSTYINHPDFSSGWATWSGTSFATPHVVAAIATQAADQAGPRAAVKHLLGTTPRRIGGYAALS